MKDGFSSKVGYVLAAAGAAVGLGNIWRFPYLAAKHGGGIFLVTYLILVLTFGYALLIAENGIGRITGCGPIGSFRYFCKDRTGFMKSVRWGGWINALVPLIIVPYYCVIGGWVTKYVVALAANPIGKFASKSACDAYFGNFISSTWEPIAFFLLFMVILVIVVAFGVQKGVERFNKILMPLLFLMIVGICIYCLFLPNAKEGFVYYFKPDFSKFSYMTVVAAMGQLFFSLSIAMGITITYGSYMCKADDLVSNVNQVEFFDTAVAFLAGMMIIPAVVAFGGKAAAEAAGPGLVFVTMPQVFANFAGGRIAGVFFFILVLLAAATSAISLLETNVQTVCQELHVSRPRAIAICVLEIIAIGVITVLGYSVFKNFHPLAFIDKYKNMDILDTLDFVSNNVMMPVAAIFTTILVVSVIGLEKFSREVRQDKKWYREYLFQLCMSVVVIPCLLVVLLQATGLLQ
ncbi:MAG: sodium-dependent transporter [Victivallaceae bacterium]|nr:sodium-dependent transporter [Victivallaceae bacterium]